MLSRVFGKAPASYGVAVAMFIVLLATYSLNAMDRQIFPLLLPDVRKEFGFGLADGGLLSTVFTLGMAVAGLPAGYLLSRFSRKTVVVFGIAIFSIGTVLTAYAFGFADMLLYRAGTGIGEAMQLTALIAIAVSYFTKYRSAAIGSINVCFGIGAIVAPTLGTHLLTAYQTWRAPIVTFGAAGFVAIIVVWLAVRPWFSEKLVTSEEVRASRGAPVLLNRNTVILTVLSVLFGLINYAYLGLYPTFLREALKYTPERTGSVMAIYGLGVLASIFGGWLGDKFSPRRVLGSAFLIVAALGYLLFHGNTDFALQATMSFIWGLVVSGTIYVNIAGYHVKAVQPQLSSRASGLFVTSFYGSAAVAGYILGFLASSFGWATAAEIQITAVSIAGAVLTLGLRADVLAGVPAAGRAG